MLRLLSNFADNLYRHHVGTGAFILGGEGAVVGVSKQSASPKIGFLESLSSAQTDASKTVGPVNGVLFRVAVPDYDVYFRRYQFTKLPSKPKAAKSFLEWRIREDLAEVQSGCDVALGPVDISQGHASVVLIRHFRLEEISNSVDSLGGTIDQIKPLYAFLLERFLIWSQTQAVGSNQGFILLCLWRDYWTMINVGANEEILHVRSCRWIEANPGSDEISELFRDSSHFMASAQRDCQGDSIYLVGDTNLCKRFQELANASGTVVDIESGLQVDEDDPLAHRKFLVDTVMHHVE